MRRVLLVDAFDSFVHTVAAYLAAAGADPVVVRSNRVRASGIGEPRPDAILLGPGPGHPAESGHVELVRAWAGRLPIFGICLGLQAVGLAFGGRVTRARPMHGKTSLIRHDGRGVFTAQPDPFPATRYHSLVVAADSVPDCLEVSARAVDDGQVMGLRHRWLAVDAVQFHPESVCTERGFALIENFLAGLGEDRPAAGIGPAVRQKMPR